LKKYSLSICAIMKNEAPYLIEWLEFHTLVGVENFYLYDNDSDDNTKEIIEPYIASGKVVFQDWKIRPGMLSAYSHCLNSYGKNSQWIAFIDLDEFLFPSTTDDLKLILNEFFLYPAIAVNWLTFGSSGHKKRPDGLQLENYTRRAEDDSSRNRRVKCIVQPELTIAPLGPHLFSYTNNSCAVTENKEPLVAGRSNYNSIKYLRINHYRTRSEEECRQRDLLGEAITGGSREAFYFETDDRNEVEDLTIQRFVSPLKRIINGFS
jgi:glycosyltransferase involved in cell wall biosynthesis